MSKYDESHGVKIEAGQILDPDHFPPPNELVCIQVPKVFDQVAIRDCITRTITLTAGSGVLYPVFTFEGASDFQIIEVKVIKKTDSLTKAGFKKLKLSVKIRYTVTYSDGINELTTADDATFVLTINEIYCPDCIAEIGVIRYPEDLTLVDKDGLLIKVEALAEAFNDAISGSTLTLDIGVFFVIKCECEVQLLIPSFGYCPVPPEQQNPSSQSCTTFTDKTKTPFPTAFFPDQKWNPLDKTKKEEWDD